MNYNIDTLKDGLVHQLRDLFSAENQLLKALPSFEKKARSKKLKEAIRGHLLETEGHVERLNQMGRLLDEKLSGTTCKAMQGLVEECEEVIELESENSALIDVLLIGAAERVEHYEMAAYGSAHAIALELGQDVIAELLEETLDEEIRSSKSLSAIAQEEVLPLANQESESDQADGRVADSIAKRSSGQRKSGNSAKVLGLAGCLLLFPQFGTLAFAENAPKQLAISNTEPERVTVPKMDRELTLKETAERDELLRQKERNTHSYDSTTTGRDVDPNKDRELTLTERADRDAMLGQNERESRTYDGDNTGRNLRDRDDARLTPQDQALGGVELQVVARIRKEIVANDELSTNARNVKIIAENGKVFLRGPVKSAEEKEWIGSASARLAPNYQVVNQLETTPG